MSMCFDDKARPPIAPVAGAALDGRDLTLTSADGTHFMAYAARAAQPTGAGMIVLPDVRGLHAYYKELAMRFAEAGIDAVAIDYFGRTANTSSRDESFDYAPHVAETRPESVAADVGAAASYLRDPEGGSTRSLFTVGFCFGGAASFLQASDEHGLAGVIGFYGWPQGSPRRPAWPAPVDRVRDYQCPVLALFGGADEGISSDDVERFERALREAGVQHESVTYPGAPHSFFDRRQTEFADASADAWRRVLEFVKKHASG
jgi:carboxymethylenebutenolidase